MKILICAAKYRISAMTNNMIETTPNICPARENAFLRVVKFCPEHCGAELEKDSNMCPVCGYDRALAKNLRLEYAEKTLDVLEKYGAADKPRQSASSVVGFILGLASFFCGCNIILAIMAIAFSCESGQNLTTPVVSADGTHIAVLFQFRAAMLALKHIYIPLFSLFAKAPLFFDAGLSVRYFLRFTYLVWSSLVGFVGAGSAEKIRL